MPAATHNDVVTQVIAILKSIDLTDYGIRSTDIHEADYPFNSQPPRGLIVTGLTEQEGVGLNNAQDLGYPVQIMRAGHSTSNSGGTQRRSWRDVIHERFNHKRIGLDQELMTKCSFAEMELDSAWRSWNIDASILRTITWIRKKV